MKELVGRVLWGEEMLSASLFADGTWEVADGDGHPIPLAAATFARIYGDSYQGPQDGRPGVKALTELAANVRGTLVLEDQPLPDFDAVN
jgi:hypothetical protein